MSSILSQTIFILLPKERGETTANIKRVYNENRNSKKKERKCCHLETQKKKVHFLFVNKTLGKGETMRTKRQQHFEEKS